MNIELKEAAQQVLNALDEATTYTGSPSWSPSMTDECIAAASALRTALAQQPATGEPVAHLWQHGETGRTRIVMLGDVWTANDHWCYVGPLVLGSTHPAPSVPATPEPVVSRNPFASRCYTMSESHLSGHRLIVGFEKLGDAQDAHEWVTRQGRGDFTHQEPELSKQLKNINSAMEDAQPATAIACGIPGMAKTTCPYCEQGFAFEHEQPATPEPVGGEWFCGNCRVPVPSPVSHPAPSVPDDVVRDAERYRYLRDIRRRDAIVLSGPEAGVWCDAEDEDGTLLLLTEDDLDAAIDAAMLAAK